VADVGRPGDRGAVNEEQIEDIRRRLSRAVTRVCPYWLAAHSEDIVQIAMLRVLSAARTRGEGPPDLSSLYLEKTAYSAMVDEIRRHRRRREDPAEGTLDRASGRSDADPESAVAAREVADGLRACLAILRTPRRLAVTLHLQGHTVPEVASILKWRSKRAENLVYRGIADLRRCLSMKGLAR
jgi:RNA polymerase sigma-70 factor, ECF subfamily